MTWPPVRVWPGRLIDSSHVSRWAIPIFNAPGSARVSVKDECHRLVGPLS